MINNTELEIEDIQSSNDFEYLFNLSKDQNFFDDINDYAIPSLNEENP